MHRIAHHGSKKSHDSCFRSKIWCHIVTVFQMSKVSFCGCCLIGLHRKYTYLPVHTGEDKLEDVFLNIFYCQSHKVSPNPWLPTFGGLWNGSQVVEGCFRGHYATMRLESSNPGWRQRQWRKSGWNWRCRRMGIWWARAKWSSWILIWLITRYTSVGVGFGHLKLGKMRSQIEITTWEV